MNSFCLFVWFHSVQFELQLVPVKCCLACEVSESLLVVVAADATVQAGSNSEWEQLILVFCLQHKI